MTDQDYNNRTAEWMNQLESDPALKLRPLPDPDLLWMKAQLLERQARMAKMFNPVERLDMGLRIVLGCTFCWLALTFVASLSGELSVSIPHVWISVAVSVAVVIAAIAAYPVWAGE